MKIHPFEEHFEKYPQAPSPCNAVLKPEEQPLDSSPVCRHAHDEAKGVNIVFENKTATGVYFRRQRERGAILVLVVGDIEAVSAIPVRRYNGLNWTKHDLPGWADRVSSSSVPFLYLLTGMRRKRPRYSRRCRIRRAPR